MYRYIGETGGTVKWVTDECVIKTAYRGEVSLGKPTEDSKPWPNPTGSQRPRETCTIYAGQLPGAQSKGEQCREKVCRNEGKIPSTGSVSVSRQIAGPQPAVVGDG